MILPQKILPYCCAKIWGIKSTTTYLSKLVSVSHDFLTRSLKFAYNWKSLFSLYVSRVDLSNGYYIIDETELDKSYAKHIKGLSWLYSHLKNGYVFGYQFVVLSWTDGDRCIPLSWKLYKKKNKKTSRMHKTKTDLAIELLEYAFTHLCKTPKGVLFDSFYSSEKILKYISSHKILYYSQVASNRCFNGLQLKKQSISGAYWTKGGTLTGNIHVVVCRHRKKYFITNDLSCDGKTLRTTYKLRWKIEEIFRFVKTELDLAGNQMRDIQSQINHLGVCFFLYLKIWDSAEEKQMTMYQVREELLLNKNILDFTTLIEFSSYA